MALIICEECGKEFSDKAGACPNCGCPNFAKGQAPIIMSNNTHELCQDKYSKEEVVKHLKYAGKLETTIFTLKTAYGQMENKIFSLGHKRLISPPAKAKCGLPVWGTFFIPFFVLLIWLRTIAAAFVGAVAITLVSRIVYVVIKNHTLVKAYQKEVFDDKERVLKEKEQIEMLSRQQKSIQDEIERTEQLLKKLYSLDILFPTYRHMVAVLTILEYLESGRCSQLTGAHGAYDTYSTEEKQNKIIGKLDMVINMLDDIRYNQSVLYNSIQEANENACRIYEQSERMIQSNTKIAENTALTAYNTNIIKQNTTISAYVDMFGKSFT